MTKPSARIKIGDIKPPNHNELAKTYAVTFKNHKPSIVVGSIYLFSEENPTFPIGKNINLFNAKEVVSICEINRE